MDLWNTIKKDENWKWIDTNQRLLENFPETKLLDLTWQNENILDQSMSNEFIAFYAGIEGNISLSLGSCVMVLQCLFRIAGIDGSLGSY